MVWESELPLWCDAVLVHCLKVCFTLGSNGSQKISQLDLNSSPLNFMKIVTCELDLYSSVEPLVPIWRLSKKINLISIEFKHKVSRV